jgi:preprotein translocase subunit SecA
LIDEAITPLILSASLANVEQVIVYKQAILVASQLIKNSDYLIDFTNKNIKITNEGITRIQQFTADFSGVWVHATYKLELIQVALSALNLYQKDQDYLIESDEIKVIDLLTGRVAEGRVWSKGLHQLIAIKENVTPPAELSTLTQITFQNFFLMYNTLGGMSGTLKEASSEFYDVYGLNVFCVPLNQPNQLVTLPMRMFLETAPFEHALIESVRQVHALGRPILIGTDSVEDSEHLSLLLKSHHLPHQVLNARQNKLEANIVEMAGEQQKITIATNMAGRGTDIKISPEVSALGGLHVISCQHNKARRIDRQLIGRAARHGQAGSAEILFNANVFKMSLKSYKLLANYVANHPSILNAIVINWFFSIPKYFYERQQRTLRKSLQAQDNAVRNKNLSI